MDMFKKVKGLGAKTILVSNDPGITEENHFSFVLPAASNDMISAFYIAVFSQMFACGLSLSKNLDPDRPRTLSKVTITR
jgi:glucosamine--fructose-6-phosphate aminotransferase (isomerizing)